MLEHASTCEIRLAVVETVDDSGEMHEEENIEK
jgi:hypothetical protein